MEYMHENVKPFFLPGDEHAVLLTHGFTGSAAHMRPLGDYLHAQGFTVRGILLPGHGTSAPGYALGHLAGVAGGRADRGAGAEGKI